MFIFSGCGSYNKKKVYLVDKSDEECLGQGHVVLRPTLYLTVQVFNTGQLTYSFDSSMTHQSMT